MGHMIFDSALRVAAFGAVLVCLPTAAQAQSSFPRLGVDVGYAYLLDSKARAAFGSGVTEFGVGFGNITPTIDGKVGIDVSIMRPRETENGVRSDALVVSVGPEYRKIYIPSAIKAQIEQQRQSVPNQTFPPGTFPPGTQMPKGVGGPPPILPYYGASANLVYAQVDAPNVGVNGNGFGIGGSLFAGLTFNDRFFVEGRLRGTSSVESFNFSRAGIEAGLRF